MKCRSPGRLPFPPGAVEIDVPVQEGGLKKYHTEIGWSSANSITLFGMSLPDDILGKLSFGDMAFRADAPRAQRA